ncbi:hypothetical protein LTR17_014442 [Elasticomyces elasticus]|nr:hypothetical protein LTR17_014442 [Elasticomyces elasticus]
MGGNKFDDTKLDALTPQHRDYILKRRAWKAKKRQSEKQLREAGDADALARDARQKEQQKECMRRRKSKESTALLPISGEHDLHPKKRKQIDQAITTPAIEQGGPEQTFATSPRRRLRNRASLSPTTLSRLREPSQPVHDISAHDQGGEVPPTPAPTARPESSEPRAITRPVAQAVMSTQTTRNPRPAKKELVPHNQPVIDLCDSDDDAKPAIKSEGLASKGSIAPDTAPPQAPSQAVDVREISASYAKQPQVEHASRRKQEELEKRIEIAKLELELLQVKPL